MWAKTRVGLSVGVDHLALAVVQRRTDRWVVQQAAVETPEPGLCHPSPIEQNILNLERWKARVIALLHRFPKVRRVTLSLPDASVRTLLLTLQQVPPNPLDLEKLIAWHMEKHFLHPLGESRIAYQRIAQGSPVRLLAVSIQKEIAGQYESFETEGRIQIDRMGPASLYVLNLFWSAITRTGARSFLFVHLFDQTLTCMIFEDNVLNFIRIKEFTDHRDQVLITELSLLLSFYEGNGKSSAGLTHLFWLTAVAWDISEPIRETLNMTVVRLESRHVLQSETLSSPIMVASAAAT